MTTVQDLVADMVAEADALDALVSDLDDATWRTPTPATGWTIAHQIGHLLWTDRIATISAVDPDGFADVLAAGATDPVGFINAAADAEARASAPDILTAWRTSRDELASALLAVSSGTKLAWFGPPMSAASMATARIMETWAHGLDIADTLDVPVTPTPRIRAVAHIGARTRDFAYIVNGRTPPAAEFRIELDAPDGDTWTWGPADASDRVIGPALDFCQLVTQRRALADLDLTVIGNDAAQWASIAQCFAGPPGSGRAPRSTEMSSTA